MTHAAIEAALATGLPYKAQLTLEEIDAQLEAAQEAEHRTHLGASVIGDDCHRKGFYGFRWAVKELFSGQMLRLFDRGHMEESRFVRWLAAIGVRVFDMDPATGKQWRVSDCNGHFGGSLDGIACGIPDLPPGVPFLCEFKTHNSKSFRLLETKGVVNAHRKHFVQMQAYGNLKGLTYALYIGVNKDNDELWPEIVRIDPREGRNVVEKARTIIFSPLAPKRMTTDSTNWKCKFCAFRQVCHFGAMPERNCRTCAFSQPIDGGQWFCGKYSATLSTETQRRSDCPSYLLHPAFKS